MMKKRTQARNRRRQLREINELDRIERRLERTAMPKIRKQLNQIGRDAAQAYMLGGELGAEFSINGNKPKIAETLEGIYKSSIKKTEKLLKELYPKDKSKVEQVRRELERNFRRQAERAAEQISKSTVNQVKKVAEKDIPDHEKHEALKKKLTSNGRRAQLISEVEIGSVTAEGRDKISRKIYDKATRKVWVTTRDSKVRDAHQYAEGQTVGIKEDFVLRGRRSERAPYPRHRSLSAANRCNCLLPDSKIGFCNPNRIFRRLFVGEVFTIDVEGLENLSVTANHPILTDSGWKPARLINKFDKVIVDNARDLIEASGLDIKAANSTVSEIFNSSVESGVAPRSISGRVNFHGDIPDSDVQVVDVGGSLLNSSEPKFLKCSEYSILEFSDSISKIFPDDSSVDEFLFRSLFPSDSIVSSFRDFVNFIFGCVLKSNEVGFTSTPDLEAELIKAKSYYFSGDIELLRHFKDRDFFRVHSFNVVDNELPLFLGSKSALDRIITGSCGTDIHDFRNFRNAFPILSELLHMFKSLRSISKRFSARGITKISRHNYSGFVYNIEDKKVFYTASAIVNHNCRCRLIYE